MRGYLAEPDNRSNRAIPAIALVLCVAGAAASILMAFRLSGDALSKAGFVFGGLGLIVSLAGFGFTIWQLMRTQHAAAAATQALDEARRQFATLDVLGELHIMRITSESVREHVVGLRWPSANFGYDRLREKLMRVISVPDQLTGGEIETAKDYVAHILGVSSETEALSPGDAFESTRLTGRLKELENFALQLEYRIRNQFSGS